MGYLRSWSATARMQQATGVDPVQELAPRLAAVWGDPGGRRTISWPISLRAGRP